MKENLSKNNFIFDWMGAIALIGGMLVGSSLIAGANVISIYAVHENLQYKDFYLVFANAAGFLSAIFAFDYFIVEGYFGFFGEFSDVVCGIVKSIFGINLCFFSINC